MKIESDSNARTAIPVKIESSVEGEEPTKTGATAIGNESPSPSLSFTESYKNGKLLNILKLNITRTFTDTF